MALSEPASGNPSARCNRSGPVHTGAQRLLIKRITGTHRYQVTRQGWRASLFFTRTYNRVLQPGLAQIVPIDVLDDSELRRGFDEIDQVIDRWIEKAKVPT